MEEFTAELLKDQDFKYMMGGMMTRSMTSDFVSEGQDMSFMLRWSESWNIYLNFMSE